MVIQTAATNVDSLSDNIMQQSLQMHFKPVRINPEIHRVMFDGFRHFVVFEVIISE